MEKRTFQEWPAVLQRRWMLTGVAALGFLLVGLVMGAVVLWSDVYTVVAAYNVSAYQAGRLETVDVHYLANLSDGAVPYLAKLTQDSDPDVAESALRYLQRMGKDRWEDFRDWNYVNYIAETIVNQIP